MRFNQGLAMRTVLRMLILLSVSTLAVADSGVSLPTPTAAAAGTYAHDLFNGLFGSFGDSPWTQVGGTTSLLGQIFLIYNAFIFSVGVSWSSFNLVGATVQTAHEGEVFGKRFSTVWLPVRMIFGMGALVPVFSGYSAAQAIMMSAALMGNSVAEDAYSALITAVSAGTALVTPANGTVSNLASGNGVDELVGQMFLSSACVHYNNALAIASGGTPIYFAAQPQTMANGLSSALLYGSIRPDGAGNLTTECGKVVVKKKASTAHTTVNSVNYDAIAAQAYSSTTATVQSFATQVDTAAKQWVDAVTGNSSFDTTKISNAAIPDLAGMKSQFVTQLATARQQAFTSGLPAITQDAQPICGRGAGWPPALGIRRLPWQPMPYARRQTICSAIPSRLR